MSRLHRHRPRSAATLARLCAGLLAALALAACGGGGSNSGAKAAPGFSGCSVAGTTPDASARIGFPTIATKNTTRVCGSDAIADAAAVALAVFPSQGSGTHPSAVAIAPTDAWQAAIASAVLMAPPIHAPILLSGKGTLPAATAAALKTLAPTGSGVIAGAQVIPIGDVPSPSGLHAQPVTGADPYALAAKIDGFASAARGNAGDTVMIASGENAAFAMPAAGWAAESGDPVLFVKSSSIPSATVQALLAHQHPHIYVLGPPSVISDSVLKELGKYGTVKRVGDSDPASNSVAFAIYRDPACPFGQPCAHVPGSFGWAMRSPGHGYVLLNSSRPLDAAAAAPLSGSGDFGPQLVTDSASSLPRSVLNFFLDYATPGYTQEGPTAAVYNHGWVIGDTSAISMQVQAELDNLLEVVPQK